MFTKVCVVILLTTTSALADTYTCQEELAACDQAYSSQKVLIKDLEIQRKNLSERNVLQDRIISDQKSELDNPLKDPVKVGAVAIVLTIGVMLLTGHVK